LALGALGVVYGDIGTSPLYTMKTALGLAGGGTTPAVVLGLLSLIVWTLLITTSIKYVAVVMRADNEGEGGILALMSLLSSKFGNRLGIVAIGVLGAALLYGDGAITPAISVLSALEGLKLPVPAIEPYIVPLSIIVLVGVFGLQPQGSARIGKFFGPIMAIWFITIGVLGIGGLLQNPAVLIALDPRYGLIYLFTHGFSGFLVLGGIFLCATGAEALYADMGHFGRRPIRVAWYRMVLPMLVLNYAGQTAIVMQGGAAAEANPFFVLCPEPLQVPLVGLATAATIIASQAIVSGAFSMTRQAIQLGLCPRLHIKQTSAEGYGQIYVGFVNWLLMTLTLVLTITFRSSDNLAAAYGIAVALTMLLTSVLMFRAMRGIWRWNLALSLTATGMFLIVDLAFAAANMMKLFEGGWVPIVVAGTVFILMWTWRTGREAMLKKMEQGLIPLSSFTNQMRGKFRVPGTAAYLTSTYEMKNLLTPVPLLHNFEHNKAVHERMVLLNVATKDVPRVAEDQRIKVQHLEDNFHSVVIHYGFMEHPDIPQALEGCAAEQLSFDLMATSFFVGRFTIVPARGSRWHWIRVKLFALMHRNALAATEFFLIPPNRAIELGGQIEI
jgi:KUP system potassium uptake protein